MKHHSLKSDELSHAHLGLETAIKRSTNHVPIAYPEETIEEVQQTLMRHGREQEYETIHYIYVVTDEHKLVGVLSVKELFRSPPHTMVKTIMNTCVVYVHPHTDQEHVAIKALQHKLGSIPIVDKDHKLLGVVTDHSILSILHAEHTEDFLRLAGIHTFKDPSINIINASASTHIIKRIPWLLLGLAGGLIAAAVVSSFEEVLREELILAAFIPSIVYIADAVGTQTQTLFIRSLALDQQLNLKSYIVREGLVSLMIASILGLVMAIATFIFWKSEVFTTIFGVSIFITILTAMAVAIVIPLLCRRLKLDPAIASGPFATVLRDITSLLIYFSISQYLLGVL